MNYLSLISLVCFAVVLVNASDTGYYVPKGYYVIHADGHQSPLSKITPEYQKFIHHRLRRSPQFSSSSSSSSSSASSNGGPVYFQQSTSSHVSPGGISSQGYYPGVIGSINDRFNGEDDDDDYDDYDSVPYNNRPGYSSSQTQTGSVGGVGYQQTVSANGIHTRTSGILNPSLNGNGVHTHSSSISYPTSQGIQTQSTGVVYPSANGNGNVYTLSNNNGRFTQTSGVLYPNGQVQVTSHKTGKL